MIFYLYTLLAIIFLLFLLSMVWPPDSPWAPWWRTSKKTARKMCKFAGIKKGDIVYDLGCGEGTALSIASKEFGAKGFGIEIDPLRYVFARLLIRVNGLSKNVRIKRGNLFNEDFSNADAVFVYLVPKTLEKLVPEFKKLKKGAKIISYRYEINLKLYKYDKKSGIRVYII